MHICIHTRLVLGLLTAGACRAMQADSEHHCGQAGRELGCPMKCMLCHNKCASSDHFHGADPLAQHLCASEHACAEQCVQCAAGAATGKLGPKFASRACAVTIPRGHTKHSGAHSCGQEHVDDQAFQGRCRGRCRHTSLRQVKADPASGQAPTFAEMDKDHSGDISFQEMREALLQATPGMPEDDIRRCFAQLDFNQDGKVSRAEFFGHRAEEFSGQQRGEEVAMRVVECLYRCCLHVDLDEDGDEVAHDCVCPSHAVCGRPCEKCEMVRAAHLRALERAQVKTPVPCFEVRTCALKQYHQSTHRVHSSCLPSATHFFCACDCLGSHPSLPQAPHAQAAGSLSVEGAEGTQLAAGLTHTTSSAPSATTPLSTGLFPAARSAEEVADGTANQEHDHTWEEHQQERRLQASAELDHAAHFWHAVEQGGRRVLPRGVGAGGARIGESIGHKLRHVIRVYGSAPRPVVDATLQGSAPRPRPPQDHIRDQQHGGRAKALSLMRARGDPSHRPGAPATKELEVRVTEVSHVGQPHSNRSVSHNQRPRSSRPVSRRQTCRHCV